MAWYRHVNTVEQSADAAIDMVLRETTRQASIKTLQLAFDFARAEAALLGRGEQERMVKTGDRSLEPAAARSVERISTLQSRIADLDREIAAATGRRLETLTAQRDEARAELDLAKEVQSTIQNLINFSGSVGPGSGAGLEAQVDNLERTAPEAQRNDQSSAAPNVAAAASAPATRVFHPETAGIVSLTDELLSIHGSRAQLEDTIRETGALTAGIDRLRVPLSDQTGDLITRGDQLANQSAAQNPTQLAAAQKELSDLAARFKQLSTAIVPLGEEGIAAATTRSYLEESVNALDRESREAGRYLLLRAGTLAIVILIVLAISELWRRATFRYVKDARRRRPVLVLRRVVVTVAIILTIVLGFVSQFGSLATYAGLITAGLAVALQNVILSVVAYFFLIGRYGIRVGDRVTVSGVTGDVIEIGLVRFYMMELAGPDLHSTGRVVVNSNGVIFQPVPLYKQMPGVDYVWHTVELVLAPESDFQLAQKKLNAAVDSVYQQYRSAIEIPNTSIDYAFDVAMASPHPVSRLRFTDAGLEFTVRYPAELRQAAAMDDQLMKALYEAIAAEPKLDFAPEGTPKLHQAA